MGRLFRPPYGGKPLDIAPLLALIGLNLDEPPPQPMPQKGDELIVVPTRPQDFDNPDDLACLTQYPPDWNWQLYACSYRRAATILANWAVATAVFSDTLVLPIVFLFRQYLEVTLKCLIACAEDALGKPPAVHRTHDLDRLQRLAKDLLLEAFALQSDDRWSVTEECIRQVNAWDCKSMLFRYPVDTRGAQPKFQIPNGPDAGQPAYHLHLRAFRDTMEKIANFLDAIRRLVNERMSEA